MKARLIVKIILPVIVIGVSFWVAQQIFANKPQPKRRPPVKTVTSVEATHLATQDYQVSIRTQGTVRPRTESTLIPEVSGRIVSIAKNFRAGGFFEQGDVLLQIDPRDYQIAVTIAESQQAKAQMAVEEEQARADVAEREWRQLKKKPTSSRLALRKPQQAAAAAELAAAEAQFARAKLDMERTRIIAPYAGRILEQHADIGQYVSSGTVLARVYAVDYAEIRLPLSPQQLDFIDLPEHYRHTENSSNPRPQVTLTARGGRDAYHWQGEIVRVEGAIDTKSQQLFVIAQIDDPYAKSVEQTLRPPLRVGQFVEAEIQGRQLKDVFVLPRAAVRNGNEVVIIDDKSQLQRRIINPLWSDVDRVVVDAGLQVGELLSLTPLGSAINGIEVAATIIEDKDTETGTESQRPRLAQRHKIKANE